MPIATAYGAAFRVPVFEQVIGKSGKLLAAECEAHDGLHVASPALSLARRMRGRFPLPLWPQDAAHRGDAPGHRSIRPLRSGSAVAVLSPDCQLNSRTSESSADVDVRRYSARNFLVSRKKISN